MPVALGVKVTLMVQELPGANEAGHKFWNVKSAGVFPVVVKPVMLSAVKPTFFSVNAWVELWLTTTWPKLNEPGVNWGSGSMTLAESGTCCVKPALTTFSVAVDTPNCDALVTCGAVKVMVTVQE